MRGQNPRAERDFLRDRWSRWTAIVALHARRRPGRRGVDPRAYATLRNDLIAACRSLAEADGERRSYYTALEDLVRPWIDLRVLARTDREILCTLLSRCREVEQDLGGRRWRREWPFPFAPAPMIAAGAALVALAWALLAFGSPVLAVLRGTFDAAWLTVKYSGYLGGFPMLSLVAVLLVVAAMFAISRTARS
jgi:hypothetical protein